MTDHDRFMKIAFEQAQRGADEGGVPVGACLVRDGRVVAEGRNRRQQERTIVLHGETDCLRQAGLFGRWSECTMYTTLSPCMMCTGTIIQFRIPRVVIGDAVNFGGNEGLLRERGVEVTVMNVPEMIDCFAAWMKTHSEIWNGDIGL